MASRSSSVSLPHCSFTAPLVWVQLPLNFSQIVLVSAWTVWLVVWAWTMVVRVPRVTAAQAAAIAIERMGAPGCEYAARRAPSDGRLTTSRCRGCRPVRSDRDEIRAGSRPQRLQEEREGNDDQNCHVKIQQLPMKRSLGGFVRYSIGRLGQ